MARTIWLTLAIAGCQGVSGLGDLRVDPCFASDGGASQCSGQPDAASVDPCAQPSADTLYVDGARGSDAGAGTCQSPLRSVTRALERANQALEINRVFLLGGAPGAPVIYSAASTGETFPLRVTRRGRD